MKAKSYLVARYGKESSATRKYKGCELYLLPPSIFPHNPIDTTDQRYLNFSHAPIVSPLKKSLQIELYNDTYFPSNYNHISKPSFNEPSCNLDDAVFQAHDSETNIPPASTLFESIKTAPPVIESHHCGTYITEFSPSIYLSNKLFFVQYTPENTIRRRWYWIQVDMQSTQEVNADFATNVEYWCVFLSRHPHDEKKSKPLCR